MCERERDKEGGRAESERRGLSIPHSVHRYHRRKNRLVKFVYVPVTSAAHNRLLFFFFAAAIYSTNEANKTGGTRH